MTAATLVKTMPEGFDYEHCLDGCRGNPVYTQLFIRGLARKHGWSIEKATRAFVDAIKFCLLCVQNPGEFFVPSEDVDAALDYAILDMAAFRLLERNVLGAPFDHIPAHEIDPVELELKRGRYDITREIMIDAGDGRNNDLWPPKLHAIPCQGNGGGGDGGHVECYGYAEKVA